MREVAKTVAAMEYVKEMTGKKSCKYGEYGAFQHLVFLLRALFCLRGCQSHCLVTKTACVLISMCFIQAHIFRLLVHI